jgi:serine/threonine-protein kinase SRPK3
MDHEARLFGDPIQPPLNAERVESYQLGGFHPVDIGDTFQEGRYKIVRKLGHGSSSTVWLAQDTR